MTWPIAICLGWLPRGAFGSWNGRLTSSFTSDCLPRKRADERVFGARYRRLNRKANLTISSKTHIYLSFSTSKRTETIMRVIWNRRLSTRYWTFYLNTDSPKKYKFLRELATTLAKRDEQVLTYFLDGSRHVYKVEDRAYPTGDRKLVYLLAPYITQISLANDLLLS